MRGLWLRHSGITTPRRHVLYCRPAGLSQYRMLRAPQVACALGLWQGSNVGLTSPAAIWPPPSGSLPSVLPPCVARAIAGACKTGYVDIMFSAHCNWCRKRPTHVSPSIPVSPPLAQEARRQQDIGPSGNVLGVPSQHPPLDPGPLLFAWEVRNHQYHAHDRNLAARPPPSPNDEMASAGTGPMAALRTCRVGSWSAARQTVRYPRPAGHVVLCLLPTLPISHPG